jgi:hypothetical protein
MRAVMISVCEAMTTPKDCAVHETTMLLFGTTTLLGATPVREPTAID